MHADIKHTYICKMQLGRCGRRSRCSIQCRAISFASRVASFIKTKRGVRRWARDALAVTLGARGARLTALELSAFGGLEAGEKSEERTADRSCRYNKRPNSAESVLRRRLIVALDGVWGRARGRSARKSE
jgi:hypothetical protein